MDAVAVTVALACFLAPVYAGSSSCDIGQYWEKIPTTLSWVSSGDAGVWGVNSAETIFYREGSYIGSSNLSYSVDGRNYGFSITDGTSWTVVSGTLKQVDVGKNSVWGIHRATTLVYRRGISRDTPIGTDWQIIDGLDAAQVSVSDIDSKVWVLESGTGNVYRRVGISNELPAGSGWERVPGISAATSIDVGGAGVWATTANGDIYYRTGSRQDSQGSSWQQVSGRLKQIASGGDAVWGLMNGGDIWFRTRITSALPTGSEWLQVPGNMKQISVATTNNDVWGIQPNGDVYNRHQ